MLNPDTERPMDPSQSPKRPSAHEPGSLYRYDAPAGTILLELVTGFVAAMALIGPRGIAAWLSLWFAAVFVVLVREHGWQSVIARVSQTRSPVSWPVWLSFAGVTAFAFASVMWSKLPFVTMVKPLQVSAVLAATYFAFRMQSILSRRMCWHIARGIVHGVIIGVAYLLFEHVTDGGIKRWFLNNTNWLEVGRTNNVIVDGEVVSVNRLFLNRHTTALALLIWPTLFAVSFWLGRSGKWLTFGVWATGLAMALISKSESAKVAVMLSGVILMVSCFVPRFVRLALSSGWIVACLGAVIIVSVLPRPETLKPYLQYSAYDRVAIWKATVKRIEGSRLLVGHGADMTIGTARLEKQSGQGLRPDRQHELSRHAHNGFLQIWFELGGIGAALLAIAGLAIPALLRRLEPFPFPFAVVAAWMTTAILLFSSAYGLWQIWLLCGYALTATFLAVVLRGFSLNNDAAGASDLVGEGTASP